MAGIDAFGTQLKRDSTGAGAFVLIANVGDIDGPSRARNAIEVTAHDSPDAYREFVKGLKDGGEVSATINFDPGDSSHQALDGDFEEKDLRAYQLIALPGDPDELTVQFNALITDLSDTYPVDDKMERSVTFKISGKPTFTYA
ncbi:phage tail tube protein [Streptomyces sp. bgisy154]|uniref:phage tail tube protein n=1 Tax=Streptomyces sp. bgisy154 TaxID=3413794 RepID=UPI003D756708